jgi:hypothetical protein
MREIDDFDHLIDSALSNYGDPGPDSGLDQRVLARISSASASARVAPASRRRWMPWAFGLPVAACLILSFFFLAGPKTAHPPTSVAKGMAQKQQVPIVTAPSEAASAHRSEPVSSNGHVPFNLRSRSGKQASRTVALPKLDVFPTPQPLTAEEQALVAFAVRAPESERRSFIEAQKQAEAPLRIAAIEIPPLDSTDKDTH